MPTRAPRPAPRKRPASLRKSLELEQRIARLEGQFAKMDGLFKNLMKELDTTWKRIASLQAQFDHMSARISRR